MPRQESQGDVPVRVLGKDDMDRSLQEVLDSLGDMDSVLPDLGQEADLARLPDS